MNRDGHCDPVEEPLRPGDFTEQHHADQEEVDVLGMGDVIDVSARGLATAPSVTDLGDDTLIDMGGGNTILLTGIDPAQLTYNGHAFGFAG